MSLSEHSSHTPYKEQCSNQNAEIVMHQPPRLYPKEGSNGLAELLLFSTHLDPLLIRISSLSVMVK